MNAIIYAAKSTEDKKGSIATQLADCRAMAQREGWTVIDEFIDEGFSAFSGNRGPGLEAARDAAEREAPCALVVQHSDRLARGAGDSPDAAEHLGEILFWAQRHEVKLRSVQDDASVTNPLLAMVMGERNYEDSKRKSLATKDGKVRGFKRGEWSGGPIPDGYKLGPPAEEGPRGIVIDDDRAPAVRRAFDLAESGISFGAIARTLNGEGLRTRRGRPWSGETLKHVLSNPVYAGRVVRNRRQADEEVRSGVHEPLIDPAAFDRLGVKHSVRKAGKGGRPSATTLLTGLAVCGRCGGPMWGRVDPYTRKDGTRRVSYVCREHKTGVCDAPRVDATVVDAAVREHLAGEFIDFGRWADEQASAAARERDARGARLAEADKDLADRCKQRDTAMARYLEKQTDTREEALERARELVAAAEQRAADAERELAAAQEAPTDAMLDVFNDLRRRLESDPGPLNERLKSVFEAFRIDTLDDEILIVPVLKEDVIAGQAGTVRLVSGEAAADSQDPALATPLEPRLLLVSPPGAERRVKTAYDACA